MEAKQTLYSCLFGGVFSTLEECPGTPKSTNYVRAIKMLDAFLERKLLLSILEPPLVNWINSNVLDDLMKDCSFECLCKKGHIEMVKWYVEKYPKTKMEIPVYWAISEGQLEVAKFLTEKYPGVGMDCSFENACKGGHLDVVIWYFEKYPETQIQDGIIEACVSGHLEVVKYLINHYTEPDVYGTTLPVLCDTGFVEACSHGHLDLAKWFVQTYPDIDVYNTGDAVFIESVEHGHLDVIKWLLENYDYPGENLFVHGCTDRTIDIAKFIASKYPLSDITISTAFRLACRYGEPEIVKWLEQTFPNLYVNVPAGIPVANAPVH